MNIDSFPSNLMTQEERDLHLGFMREAIAMAEKALENSETPVGCVLVYKDQIISRGMNDTNRSFNGTRHAEFVAMDNFFSQNNSKGDSFELIERDEPPEDNNDPSFHQRKVRINSLDILIHCTLYVTVEPCIMCASFLRQIGIRRVFFGAWNEKFGGAGSVLDILNRIKTPGDLNEDNRDYEVNGGWLREEAILLLRRFYVQENKRAPEPRDKGKRVLNPIIDQILTANK